MVRQTSVKGAYSKVGDPSVTRSSGGGGKASCYLCLGIFVVMLFLISIGGDDPSINDDNLRSGQAKHLHPTNPPPPTPAAGGDGEEGGMLEDNWGGEDGDEVVKEINSELAMAEETELETDKSALISVLGTAGHRLRKGLTKLLGKKATKEEVEEIAEEIETELEAEVTEELKDTAANIVENEVENMDEIVEEEEEEGMSAQQIREDVNGRETESKERIKSRIHESYADIQGRLRHKRAEVEKHILEERLSKKLGKQVKLVITNDKIDPLDDMLSDLPNLRDDDDDDYDDDEDDDYDDEESDDEYDSEGDDDDDDDDSEEDGGGYDARAHGAGDALEVEDEESDEDSW